MSEFAVVYNPADEFKDFKFNGHVYRVAMDGLTIIPRKSLPFCMEQLGAFGIIEVKQGENKALLNQKMLEAKAVWIDVMRTHYEKVMMDGLSAAVKRKELGLDAQPTDEEIKAKAFLTKHGFMKETV